MVNDRKHTRDSASAAHEAACLQELEQAQWRIAELNLFQHELDFPNLRLIVSDGPDLVAEAALTLIGSRGEKSSTWLWGWANESLDAKQRPRSEAVKGIVAENGGGEFVTARLADISDRHAWGLAAAAARFLKASGVFREYANDSSWFFAVGEVRHHVSEEDLAARAQVALQKAIVSRRWVPALSTEDLSEYLRVADPRGLQQRRVSSEATLINMVRRRFPGLRLDLMGADLRGPSLPWAHDLQAQLLFDLGTRSHAARDLVGVDFSGARLDGAILRGVLLSDALFNGATLIDTDLSNADLNGATFRNAFLNGANFMRTPLTGADFTGAELSRTMLTGVDLSEVVGLDAVRHMSPSEITFSTLVRSKFQVSATFLRKAGVSRGLLDDLAKGQRFPGRFQTCFLSYSSKDAVFAEKLYQSLVAAGVRMFWDRFDVVPGERLEDQIIEAIHELDRLLVVLSPHSMASEWVKKEIQLAWNRRRDSLLPIRLCAIEEIDAWTAASTLPDLGEEFPIQDFSAWQEAPSYEHAFQMLMKAFTGGVRVQPTQRRRSLPGKAAKPRRCQPGHSGSRRR